MEDYHKTQMEFLEACSAGNMNATIKLLESGRVDINFHHRINGWTGLHWASRRGHISVVDLLLQAGFDPEIKAKDGKTPIDVAIEQSVKDLLQKYIQKPSPADSSSDDMMKLHEPGSLTKETTSNGLGNKEEQVSSSRGDNIIKESPAAKKSRTNSLDFTTTPPPASPTTPTRKQELYSYGRRDSQDRTRFLLIRMRLLTAEGQIPVDDNELSGMSHGNGKEVFRRVTLPGGSSIELMKLTIERALRMGTVMQVVTLPDRIPIERDEQLRQLANSQKVEVIFESDKDQTAKGPRKSSLTEKTYSEVRKAKKRATPFQKAFSVNDTYMAKAGGDTLTSSIPSNDSSIVFVEHSDLDTEHEDHASELQTPLSTASPKAAELCEKSGSNIQLEAPQEDLSTLSSFETIPEDTGNSQQPEMEISLGEDSSASIEEENINHDVASESKTFNDESAHLTLEPASVEKIDDIVNACPTKEEALENEESIYTPSDSSNKEQPHEEIAQAKTDAIKEVLGDDTTSKDNDSLLENTAEYCEESVSNIELETPQKILPTVDSNEVDSTVLVKEETNDETAHLTLESASTEKIDDIVNICPTKEEALENEESIYTPSDNTEKEQPHEEIAQAKTDAIKEVLGDDTTSKDNEGLLENTAEYSEESAPSIELETPQEVDNSVPVKEETVNHDITMAHETSNDETAQLTLEPASTEKIDDIVKISKEEALESPTKEEALENEESIYTPSDNTEKEQPHEEVVQATADAINDVLGDDTTSKDNEGLLENTAKYSEESVPSTELEAPQEVLSTIDSNEVDNSVTVKEKTMNHDITMAHETSNDETAQLTLAQVSVEKIDNIVNTCPTKDENITSEENVCTPSNNNNKEQPHEEFVQATNDAIDEVPVNDTTLKASEDQSKNIHAKNDDSKARKLLNSLIGDENDPYRQVKMAVLVASVLGVSSGIAYYFFVRVK